jgi:hypothetical protein
MGNLQSMTSRAGRRSATSAADGSFAVSGLPSGKLQVEARAKGYDEATVDAEAGGNPLEIVLASRGVIEGIVVSRKTTKPVLSFDVKVARKKEMGSFADFGKNMAESLIDLTLPFVTTNGKFRIVGVNPGTLRLTVRAPEHGEQSTDWITLAEGETRKGILVYLEPEAAVEGTVVDAASGAPLPDCEVRRDAGGGNVLESMMSQVFASFEAKSDAEGRFRMGGLSGGPCRLVATHANYVDGSAPELMLDAGQTLTGVRIELEKGGEIFGSVSGGDGAPAPGAPVFCQELSRMKMKSVKCDANGDYRLAGLAPGNYTVTRLPDSFDLGSENFVADITSNLQTRSIRLKAGESVRVDFAGSTQGRAAVKGKVTQGGQPVAKAVVNVIVQSLGKAGGNGGMRSTSTDATGAYALDGLLAGPAFVQVNESDMGMAGGQSAAVATVTLRDGETARVDLEIPAGRIVGTVVDAATNAPLAGIAVYAASDGASGESMFELAMRRAATTRTDAEGKFSLRNLRSGAHRVIAGGSDFLGSGTPDHALVSKGGVVVPDSGGVVDVGTLRLPPAARIEGIVSDSSGHPLAGASVFLRDPDGNYLEEWTATSSNDSGHFEYGGVPTGRWDVVCRAPGFATAVVRNVSVREGEVATANAKLIGGTEVFADIGEVDFDKLVRLRVEVEGPEGRIPLTLFGLGDLQDLMTQPLRLDVIRLGRFGPGDYRVTGHLGEKTFEKKFHLAGEPELHIPVSLP